MSLSDEERRIMVELEIERAEKIVQQFAVLQEQKFWDTLVNRMYYAIFHAVSALLIHNATPTGSSAWTLKPAPWTGTDGNRTGAFR